MNNPSYKQTAQLTTRDALILQLINLQNNVNKRRFKEQYISFL